MSVVMLGFLRLGAEAPWNGEKSGDSPQAKELIPRDCKTGWKVNGKDGELFRAINKVVVRNIWFEP